MGSGCWRAGLRNGVFEIKSQIKPMEVELYNVEEIASSDASAMAADATAIELIERLGLSGQKKLVSEKTATRQTFKRMTRVDELVFKTLFPESSRVEEFESEAMPLRVLEALETAKANNQFGRFEVWHSRTRKDDPVLVGLTGEANPQPWDAFYFNATGSFLIARWGEALEPFAKLLKDAKAAWIADRKSKAKRQIAKAELALKTLDEDAELMFSTGRDVESL